MNQPKDTKGSDATTEADEIGKILGKYLYSFSCDICDLTDFSATDLEVNIRAKAAIQALITSQVQAICEEAATKEARLLEALAGMYEQYCGKKYGHNFMGAGEAAIELLEEYGVHSEDTDWDEKSDKNLQRVLANLLAVRKGEK